jgi:hypothetical protein
MGVGVRGQISGQTATPPGHHTELPLPLPHCSLNGIGGSGPDAFSASCPEGQVIIGIDVSC